MDCDVVMALILARMCAMSSFVVVRDLGRLHLLLVVLGKRVKPLERHSYPPVTWQRQTYTRIEVRLPRVFAVSGKVAQLATPVTPQTVTRHRMKCAPPVAPLPGSAAAGKDFIVALAVTLRASGA
jgi:hypothetical protein